MLNVKSFFPKIKNMSTDKKSIYFFVPYIVSFAWGILSILSVFSTPLQYVGNGFVIFSIICKLVIGVLAFFFCQMFFVNDNHDQKKYKIFQTFTGYGIVITYVFFSFPRIVAEYYDRAGSLLYIKVDFFIILAITLMPTLLYLFLRTDTTRLLLKVYDKNQLDYEKKLKKDSKLRKKEQKKLRSERNFLQNLWYEWVDIILQAILIVMLINQFLFQMYAIPSESMVPTFLKKDMVIVNKLIYGPQIPLTEWKIFSPFKPKVGDIVVFLNPETYNKESDVRYKNIFARVFQPFLYRLTFTKVDIDLKEDGNPKERFIVKRMIAGKGEKVCLLNNKVYKKTKDQPWTLMSALKNQEEWGQTNLFLKNTPGMDNQRITPSMRETLNMAENYIDQTTIDELQKDLQQTKTDLLAKAASKTVFSRIDQEIAAFLNDKEVIFNDVVSKLYPAFEYSSDRHYVGQADLETADDLFARTLHDYRFVVFYRTLSEIQEILSKTEDKAALFSAISTDIITSDDDSPYTVYMKKVNALYKLQMIKCVDFLTSISLTTVSNESIYADKIVEGLYYLSLYANGIEVPVVDARQHPAYYSLFEMSNFKDYPEAPEEYIGKGEYFLMGDNRYNSLDCRFSEVPVRSDIALDENDQGTFARTITVDWAPRCIDDKFVLGKALAIYFPFDRFRIFK